MLFVGHPRDLSGAIAALPDGGVGGTDGAPRRIGKGWEEWTDAARGVKYYVHPASGASLPDWPIEKGVPYMRVFVFFAVCQLLLFCVCWGNMVGKR